MKWSLIAVGKCAETQRTEETGGGEKPVSRKMPEAKSSSGGQRCEHEAAAAELLDTEQLGRFSCSRASRGMLLVNTLQGFFSFLPISLAVLTNPSVK